MDRVKPKNFAPGCLSREREDDGKNENWMKQQTSWDVRSCDISKPPFYANMSSLGLCEAGSRRRHKCIKLGEWKGRQIKAAIRTHVGTPPDLITSDLLGIFFAIERTMVNWQAKEWIDQPDGTREASQADKIINEGNIQRYIKISLIFVKL